MADVTITEVGTARLVQTLGAASSELTELTELNRDAGASIIGAAHIPRRTGRLASTAVVEATAVGVTVSVGGPDAPYVGFVHARNPFLTDAYTAQETTVIDLYIGRVTDAVATIQGA